MQEMQTQINKMYAGDTAAIIRGISSENDLIVMNSILAGARLRVLDEDFLAKIKDAQNSDVVLMGVPLKSVAEAAVCLLTGADYGGDDALVRDLIDNEFNI